MAGSSREAITVQPVAIAYSGYRGLPMARHRLPAYAWYGDMELAPHLLNVLDDGMIDVTISFGAPRALTLHDDRKDIARRLETATRTMLHSSHHGRVA